MTDKDEPLVGPMDTFVVERTKSKVRPFDQTLVNNNKRTTSLSSHRSQKSSRISIRVSGMGDSLN